MNTTSHSQLPRGVVVGLILAAASSIPTLLPGSIFLVPFAILTFLALPLLLPIEVVTGVGIIGSYSLSMQGVIFVFIVYPILGFILGTLAEFEKNLRIKPRQVYASATLGLLIVMYFIFTFFGPFPVRCYVRPPQAADFCIKHGSR